MDSAKKKKKNKVNLHMNWLELREIVGIVVIISEQNKCGLNGRWQGVDLKSTNVGDPPHSHCTILSKFCTYHVSEKVGALILYIYTRVCVCICICYVYVF